MFKKILVIASLLALSASVLPVSATYSESPQSSVSSITLSSSESKIRWETKGYSPSGFKVVWSKNSNPTYPNRAGDRYHYFSDPEEDSDSIDAFDGSGLYYVRVCEYLGGKCGVYSNQVQVTLGSDDSDDDSSPKACTKEYMPKCGEKNGIKKTYGNKCELESAGAKLLYAGECQSNSTSVKYRSARWTCDGDFDSTKKEGDCLTEDVWRKKASDYCASKCQSNSCGLNAFAVADKCSAVKEDSQELEKIKDKADKLANDKLESILAELKELRSLVREQQAQIKYLTSLKNDLSRLSDNLESALSQFVAYGVDDNTRRLGEGERAAVVYSYRSAFGKLPKNETELEDVIRIANGRWPNQKNEAREDRAKVEFAKVYLRDSDMNRPGDNAAVTIIAYGLRQKSGNRNLDSERQALKLFKGIYDRSPQSTSDWNIVQAIAYSGASR